ncbi:protein Wnt-4-like, partial [Ctenocephalides felis]|uniref:protein Wnt-4-like n=1 Tax=Ctenocephalides felis TaxID=7515 RepID=UPI000E6E4A99
MCDSGLIDAIHKAQILAKQHCHEQFRYERWNCTINTKLFKKIIKETAFAHALASAAIAYSVAKACASGSLVHCHCSTSTIQDSNFSLSNSICSENFQYGRKIAKKILNPSIPSLKYKQSYDHDQHIANHVLQHDLGVGLRTLSSHIRKICNCHNPNGLCKIKTCFKGVEDFKNVAKELKIKYYHMTCLNVLHKTARPKSLQFLITSPSYCSQTVGRICLNTSNCANLCCGRGHQETFIEVWKFCMCRMNGCCHMKCDRCIVEKPVLV